MRKPTNRRTDMLARAHPLKHWRIIRYWACKRYELKQADMELLLYLSDIEYFTIADFKTGTLMVSWDQHRFCRLQQQEWIGVLEHRELGKKGGQNKYHVTTKCRKMIRRLYRIISGEEAIPETKRNKIMRKSSYSHKLYALAIKNFNKRESS